MRPFKPEFPRFTNTCSFNAVDLNFLPIKNKIWEQVLKSIFEQLTQEL